MAKKILVIDDEPNIVKMVKSRLEANHHEVVVAFDGEEGLRTVKSAKPDLIVLDVMMPKMDGYTFVRELRYEKVTKDIPVIMLTVKENMRGLFAVEGVNDYIVKPFKAEELLEKIEKHLR